jgi:NAD(P)H-hydrate epimerase
MVLAGMGNNGGDGLVIARLLHAAGAPVEVVRLEHRPEPSKENKINFERLAGLGIQAISTASIDDVQFADNVVIIDALLGLGSTRPLDGALASLVKRLNRSGRPVIAIDLPSGAFAEDNAANDPDSIVRADITLTLHAPKLIMFLPEGGEFIGQWEVLPIGLDPVIDEGSVVHFGLLEEQDVEASLRPRPRFGHKGTFGHALLIAGGPGMVGAAVLSTRSALRSGAGLVTAHVPQSAADILHITCPEALMTNPGEDRLNSLPPLSPYSAIGIGPGIGHDPATASIVKGLIQDASVPLVMDADALNILAENRTWQKFLPEGTIITPHPGEFDRLLGSPSSSGYDRLQRAREYAIAHGVIVVLKGAWTAVCDANGSVTFNPTGNQGMAKGGSGDSLTGLLTGLLAQGYAPLAAARLGVFLHGLAGDLAAGHRGMDGMTVTDLVHAIPEAWLQLRNAASDGH